MRLFTYFFLLMEKTSLLNLAELNFAADMLEKNGAMNPVPYGA